MIDLKPCPFCGKSDYLVVLAEGHCDNRQYQIVCDASGEGGCGASCGWQDSLKEAKEAWNRRADIASTLETTQNEIEMLRNQLEIAHAHITRLESKYEGVANERGHTLDASARSAELHKQS